MGGRLSFLPNPVLGGDKTRQSLPGRPHTCTFLPLQWIGKVQNLIPVLPKGEDNVYELPPAPKRGSRGGDIPVRMEMLWSSW